VLRQVGAPSFLTVLKRFGHSNPAPLSFPIPGWTLAADVPAAVPGLLEVLDQLDEEVSAVGGRLYLAKDSRQSIEIFQRSYSLLDNPKSVFSLSLESTRFESDMLARLRHDRASSG